MYSNSGRKRRKVKDQIRQSKQVGLGKDRPYVGFAYTVIPNDMDRDEYLSEFYKTGLCLLITPYNQILKNVIVPQHLIQSIKFPKALDEYGSLVSYNSESISNQIVVTGIIINNKPNYPTSENVYTDHHSTKTYSLNIIKNLDARSYIISSHNTEDTTGGISFSAKSSVGKSRVTLNNSGQIVFEADDNVKGTIENDIHITIGSDDDVKIIHINKQGDLHYKDQFDNELIIGENGVSVVSETINLGQVDSEQNAVLGKKLTTWLDKLTDAILQMTHSNGNNGLPTGVPLNATSFTSLKSEINQLLSEVVKISK